jgi:hypothetical protein
LGLGFCDGNPVGHSVTLRFFYRPRGLNGAAICSGLCRCAGRSASICCAAPTASIVRSMPNRRHRRGFEQKAAKKTKGLGFCDGHSVGHSATLRFFYRPRGLNGAAICSGLVGAQADRRQYAAPPQPLPSFDQCPTEGGQEDLNRRQQRKQRGLGLGFCDGHPVGHSATLRSSPGSKWRSGLCR